MPQVFRHQIESMMRRHTPVDPELVTRYRKELYGGPFPAANIVVPHAELAALIDGLDTYTRVIASLERAALLNADRVSEQEQRLGKQLADLRRQVDREATRANIAEARNVAQES